MQPRTKTYSNPSILYEHIDLLRQRRNYTLRAKCKDLQDGRYCTWKFLRILMPELQLERWTMVKLSSLQSDTKDMVQFKCLVRTSCRQKLTTLTSAALNAVHPNSNTLVICGALLPPGLLLTSPAGLLLIAKECQKTTLERSIIGLSSNALWICYILVAGRARRGQVCLTALRADRDTYGVLQSAATGPDQSTLTEWCTDHGRSSLAAL